MDVFAPYEQTDARNDQARQRADLCNRRLRAAVDMLMESADGRLLLRWLLQLSQCFCALEPAAFDGASAAHHLFFAEGRRFVGMQLLRLAQDADPGHVPRLIQTKEDDDGI